MPMIYSPWNVTCSPALESLARKMIHTKWEIVNMPYREWHYTVIREMQIKQMADQYGVDFPWDV